MLYDRVGALGASSSRFWNRLWRAGVDVRRYNPPRLDSPFGCVSRDHRKVLSVDATRAFVAGLCVGRRSVGHVERQLEPWRDTGIELRGPAVADVEQAFVTADYGSKVGNVAVRVVATVPSTARLFRLDQLVAKRRARTGRRNFSRKTLGDRGPREFFQEDARRTRR